MAVISRIYIVIFITRSAAMGAKTDGYSSAVPSSAEG